MPYYAVLVRPGPLFKSFTLQADRWESNDGSYDFFRDGNLVRRAAAAEILRVDTYDSAKAAHDAVIAFMRDSAGGTTVRVDEGASVQPRSRAGGGSAVPLEGIALRVEER